MFAASNVFKSEGRYWLTIICTMFQTKDNALVFYSVQTEKQNRTSSEFEIHIFPSPLENKERHDLKIIRTMYQTDESISFLIGRYQSKETKRKFLKTECHESHPKFTSTPLLKIEERHKLNKETHIMNRTDGKSFVFYSGWKQKANQVSFKT